MATGRGKETTTGDNAIDEMQAGQEPGDSLSQMVSTDDGKSAAATSSTEQDDREVKRRAMQVIRKAGPTSLVQEDESESSIEPSQPSMSTTSISSALTNSASSISPPTSRSSIRGSRKVRESSIASHPGAVPVSPPTSPPTSRSSIRSRKVRESSIASHPGAVPVSPPTSPLASRSSIRGSRKVRESSIVSRPGAVPASPPASPLTSRVSPRGGRKVRESSIVSRPGAVATRPSQARSSFTSNAHMPPSRRTSKGARTSDVTISPQESLSPRQRLDRKLGADRTAPQQALARDTSSNISTGPGNMSTTSYVNRFPPIPLDVSEPAQYTINNNVSEGVVDRTTVSVPEPTPSSFDGALPAELVTAEVFDEEAEQERIRREAQAEAEERLLASALTAEATIYVDEDEDNRDSQNSRRHPLLLPVAICVSVVIIGIAVAVSVVRTRDGPTSFGSVRSNDDCHNARGPLNVTIVPDGIGNMIQASNRLATPDNYTCGAAAEEGGFGMWYFLEGNGKRVYASTCQGTSFDTQLLVFGSPSQSCEELQCIGGSDQYPSRVCGDQSAVGWRTAVNENYYILVRGFRASNTGSFTLTIDSLDDNDSCDTAVFVETVETTKQIVFGSTRDLPANSVNDSPSAWFRMEGDGAIRCASVSSEESVFSAELSILSGESCDELASVINASSTQKKNEILWITEPGISYYLTVSGTEASDVGDFFLSLKIPPSNNLCETVTVLSSVSEGSSILVHGSTEDACIDSTSPLECNGRRASQAPGVWYLLQNATGSVLMASTCDTSGDFVPQLFVYAAAAAGDGESETGDRCDSLQCVDGLSEELCGDQSSVTWSSIQGMDYYIFVNGFQNGAVGNFTLSVNEILPAIGDTCDTAFPITIGAGERKGSTVGARLDLVPECHGPNDPKAYSTTEEMERYQGVWFVVVGSGSEVTASLCHPETNYAAMLSVYEGNCDGEELRCVEVTSSVSSCDNSNDSGNVDDGQSMKVSWLSTPQKMYYVLVHGGGIDSSVATTETSLPSTGAFMLTIE